MIKSCKVLTFPKTFVAHKGLGMMQLVQIKKSLREPFWWKKENCWGIFAEGGRGFTDFVQRYPACLCLLKLPLEPGEHILGDMLDLLPKVNCFQTLLKLTEYMFKTKP